MAENNDTSDPEEVTLKDLFRVMNSRFAAFDEMRSEMNARFDQQDAELTAIRKVLDEDTATSHEVAALGDKLAMVQADVVTVKEQTRETAGQLRRLQSRIDRAGVPAE